MPRAVFEKIALDRTALPVALLPLITTPLVLPVVVGGTIRPFDVPALEKSGVKGISRGGEPLSSIAANFQKLAEEYNFEKLQQLLEDEC